MTTPIYNFAAGPAMLPQEVLQEAANEMCNWHNSGISVMEMSHRGPEFMSILEDAQTNLRTLLSIPDNYKILFMQGGAIAENAIIPINLFGREKQAAKADYINTGYWSRKSIAEAKRYGDINIAAEIIPGDAKKIPAAQTWQLSDDAAYVHICSNETIDGIEFQSDIDITAQTKAPIVADMSSNILSRVIDVSKYGLIYGGAQKNIGPAGLTIVIIRDDLIGHALPFCPSAFDFKLVADNASMYNTPPTYAIYIAGLVFQWLKRQGGIAAIEATNIKKAELLYNYLDSTPFYINNIDPTCRSRMNIPFFLKDESLNDAFLSGAKARGLLQLKGHKSVGGMRASIYNAMPLDGVKALIAYMQNFQKNHP